jgi:hypothetical protein
MNKSYKVQCLRDENSHFWIDIDQGHYETLGAANMRARKMSRDFPDISYRVVVREERTLTVYRDGEATSVVNEGTKARAR